MKSIRSNPLARINHPRRGNGLDAAVDGGRIDLTAAERAEQLQAAARRDRMFAAAERVAAVGCWEAEALDAPGVWSRGMYDLLGIPLSRRPLSHDELAALVSPEDRDGLLAAVARAGPGEGWDCEARIVTTDGYERVLRLQGRVAPAGGSGGRRERRHAQRPPRLSGVVTDVTHARRAAEDEEERFRLTFDEAPVGLALVDAARRAADRSSCRSTRPWAASSGARARPWSACRRTPWRTRTTPPTSAPSSPTSSAARRRRTAARPATATPTAATCGSWSTPGRPG